MEMDILCIGEALIDMICTDKGMPLSEGEHYLRKAGGAPTNVAAAIAALGGRVSLAARVGADPFGAHLRSVMRSFGVDISAMREDPDHFTTFAFVSLMENGERDFHFNRGADGHLGVPDVDAIDTSRFGIVHFGSATAFLPGPLQEAYRALLERAIREGRFISFDPNYRSLLYGDRKPEFVSQARAFIAKARFFKLSDEEALLITGTSELPSATAILREWSDAVFAITLGAEGALLSCEGRSEVVPTVKVDPVDTTGAGDAFVGAVLHQLQALGRDGLRDVGFDAWREIVRRANIAGARTCEYMGAMEAFRHLDKSIFH